MISGIYKIKNPNGKIYIGQSINLSKRKHTYENYLTAYKGQTKLYNSIKKYGWENHIYEIIEKCSENILLERETYWKEFYKVLEVPSLCCKIEGGFGRIGKLSIDTKNKIGKSNSKPKPPFMGDKISNHPTRGSKISKSLTGHKQSEKTKEQRRNTLKLVGGRKSKKIIQKTINGETIKIWDNAKQIKTTLNISVYDALEKRNATAGGFIWDWM
jgi:group I intron endonuclease